MAGKQWEPRGVVLTGAPGEQTATAARVPQFQEWVGWVASKRMTLGWPSPPSQTHSLCFLSTQCCSKLCTIVCLGRLLQGGAPLLVFVQPVRELLGPFDLSLTLTGDSLTFYPGYYFCEFSPHGLMYNRGKITFYLCRGNINPHQISERSFEFAWNRKDASFSIQYSLYLI